MKNLQHIIELQNAQIQDLQLIGIFLFVILLITIAVAFTFFIKIAALQSDIEDMHSTMVPVEQIHVEFEKIRQQLITKKVDHTPGQAPRIIRKHY